MKKALIVLAEGFEEIEALTPIDLLRRAGIRTDVCGLTASQVTASHGVTVSADMVFDQVSTDYDAVILPGGQPGSNNLKASDTLLSYLKEMAAKGMLIAAICAAPTVLARAGLLSGKKATCYPGCDLGDAVLTDMDVVQDERIITSRGVGTAIPFSLKLIEELAGKAAADDVGKKILYY